MEILIERRTSDIDFLVITNQSLSENEIQKLKEIHSMMEKNYPFWASRIEGSYLPKDMLLNSEPPKKPRVYINEGKFWKEAMFGNEWVLTLYALYEYGVAIMGPEPKKIIKPVDPQSVKEFSKKNLFEDWKIKINNPSSIQDSHDQVYTILTMCRILYSEKHSGIASKRVAASWVKKVYGKQWNDLIEEAEKWEYGKEFNRLNETIKFIEFTLNELK